MIRKRLINRNEKPKRGVQELNVELKIRSERTELREGRYIHNIDTTLSSRTNLYIRTNLQTYEKCFLNFVFFFTFHFYSVKNNVMSFFILRFLISKSDTG